jgi:heme oxygenase
MDRPAYMLLRLDVETHAHHRLADRPWLNLMVTGVTRAVYAEQLARAYAFEAPFEAALAHTPHAVALIGVRTRSRLLAQDLARLDYPLAKHGPRLIAPFATAPEALGWLYAVERSTRLLARVRANITSRVPDAPVSYVTDPGAEQRWRELEGVLERVARSPRVADQIMHAAHDAFRCLHDWYLREEPLRRGA